MKKIIIIITISFCINASAQSFMTNVIPLCKLENISNTSIGSTLNIVASIYDVRICSEITSSYGFSTWPNKNIIFTNETFGNVFGTIMEQTTNLIWRYENDTDTIYVYPTTNAITTRRCGPISISNIAVRDIFNETNILGLDTNALLKVAGHKEWGWMDTKISLDFDEMYVWEIFDAINKQLPIGISWHVNRIKPQNGYLYQLYFMSEFRAGEYKIFNQ